MTQGTPRHSFFKALFWRQVQSTEVWEFVQNYPKLPYYYYYVLYTYNILCICTHIIIIITIYHILLF